MTNITQQMVKYTGGPFKREIEKHFPPELVGKILDVYGQELVEWLSVEFEQIAIPIYDKYFTHEEIKSLVPFYESPVGRHVVEVTPQLTGDVMAGISQRAEEMSRQIFQEVEKRIPELRIVTDESSAVESLRIINIALVTHASTYPQCGFPDSLADLAPSDTPGPQQSDLLDEVMAADTFTKRGYEFADALTMVVGDCAGEPGLDYTVVARPIEYGKTGTRSFFTDSSGVIRATSEDRLATADDPPI